MKFSHRRDVWSSRPTIRIFLPFPWRRSRKPRPLPGPRRDLLVLGGALDRIVPTTDLALTAAWYGTLPEIVPRAGHMLMHDDAGAGAIRRILTWLDGRAIAGRRAA